MTTVRQQQRADRKVAILAILEARNQNLEGYSYFSPSMGVSEDSFEDVADQILDKLFGSDKPHPKHEYVPNAKYPWFCAHCGYGPSEKLIHE